MPWDREFFLNEANEQLGDEFALLMRPVDLSAPLRAFGLWRGNLADLEAHVKSLPADQRAAEVTAVVGLLQRALRRHQEAFPMNNWSRAICLLTAYRVVRITNDMRLRAVLSPYFPGGEEDFLAAVRASLSELYQQEAMSATAGPLAFYQVMRVAALMKDELILGCSIELRRYFLYLAASLPQLAGGVDETDEAVDDEVRDRVFGYLKERAALEQRQTAAIREPAPQKLGARETLLMWLGGNRHRPTWQFWWRVGAIGLALVLLIAGVVQWSSAGDRIENVRQIKAKVVDRAPM